MIAPKLALPTAKQLAARLKAWELRQKSVEKAERDCPRKEFLSAAKSAGFSKMQAEFILKWLALANHQHWNGRVG